MVQMPVPGSPKSYLPFLTFLPWIEGAQSDAHLRQAEDRKYEFLATIAAAAGIWHDRIDALSDEGRINADQRCALHDVMKELAESFAVPTDVTYWLTKIDEGAADLHHAMKTKMSEGIERLTAAYLAKNT